MREIVLSMFGSKYKVFTLLPKELVFTKEVNLSQKNKCKKWSRSKFSFSVKKLVQAKIIRPFTLRQVNLKPSHLFGLSISYKNSGGGNFRDSKYLLNMCTF